MTIPRSTLIWSVLSPSLSIIKINKYQHTKAQTNAIEGLKRNNVPIRDDPYNFDILLNNKEMNTR